VTEIFPPDTLTDRDFVALENEVDTVGNCGIVSGPMLIEGITNVRTPVANSKAGEV
jgi:hypothetical protein